MRKKPRTGSRIGRATLFAVFATAAILASAGCAAKPQYPGHVILLSQGTILVLTQDGVEPLVTDVVTAAVSPDGRYLLYTRKDQTVLRDLGKGTEKTVLPETGISAGWNGDGSRYFILAGCPANRLYVGRPEEVPVRFFQGRKGLYVTGGSEGASIEEEVCAELGGCLFLTNDMLVFSAFDAPMPRQGDIYANRAYLVNLAANPPEMQSTEFPRQERWRFVDASDTADLVLLSVERNPESAELFQNKVYTCPRFKEWTGITFQNEVQLSFARWENGSWGNAGELAGVFMPVSNRIFALANEQTSKGWNLYTMEIDPETAEAQRGPALPLRPGQIINRPVFDPDERQVALLANLGNEENITVIDLEANTTRLIWKVKASKGGYFDARLDRLLAWLD
jgi:hypothetical protein